MNAAQVHLIVVHVPALGCVFATIVLLCGLRWAEERVQKLALSGFVLCAVFAAISYYSGPGSFEHIEQLYWFDNEVRAQAETHALWGRGGFIGMVLLGLGSLVAWLSFYQGQPPARWLKLTLVSGGGVLFLVFVWIAHQGGIIRRLEMVH